MYSQIKQKLKNCNCANTCFLTTITLNQENDNRINWCLRASSQVNLWDPLFTVFLETFYKYMFTSLLGFYMYSLNKMYMNRFCNTYCPMKWAHHHISSHAEDTSFHKMSNNNTFRHYKRMDMILDIRRILEIVKNLNA